MKHLETLGSYENFNYVLYLEPTNRLVDEYKKMFQILSESGFVLSTDWDLTGGILLENDKEVIAGIFFNTKKYNKAILIHLAYVSPDYRKKGIYTKLHYYIDKFGKFDSRKDVYSYIHLDNKPMVEYIGNKIGYQPIMQLVKRSILE